MCRGELREELRFRAGAWRPSTVCDSDPTHLSELRGVDLAMCNFINNQLFKNSSKEKED